MRTILGIDLGTSSVKAMLFDAEQGVIAVRAEEYGVDIAHPGWAQQSPALWWESLVRVLRWLESHYREAYRSVCAVGYSGQMHGMVLTDAKGQPVRPAVIWLDQRADRQLEEIGAVLSEEDMGNVFCNRVSSGFAFPSLLWVREQEPEIFARAAHFLSPKDYIRYKMTGEIGAEVVDASSTTLFATGERDWAWEVIDRFHLPPQMFPKVHESADIAGTVTAQCEAQTGLPAGIPVIYGSGDQPAQSIGNGVIGPGRIISNIGTGGQISAFSSRPAYDKKLRTNTFCHAIRNAWTIFGATLCSGMSLSWAKNKVFRVGSYEEINAAVAAVSPGADGLIYLPYLSGERTPHMNPDARGVFFGMTLGQEQGHFLRAVMEGVTYSLRDCLGILQELGIDAPEIIASGGATASPQWMQMQADILGKPVRVSRVKEQACLGSCLLAAVGTGVLPSLEEACGRFALMDERVYLPDAANADVYREGYDTYRRLYERLWDLM
ncbi:MAG TPA: xylulokinase [Candidatus Anaerobutyricum stercoripullorum]|uniref:Xylulose kinase n=1 Tax=Candidatus Anaerobutyricum stercoripullorum TaxID=2838456 RepID=A0A9D1X4Z3_9FIRM|nr:xylulokinase [Candidatus Anaerobutyricum stercoripullorum]